MNRFIRSAHGPMILAIVCLALAAWAADETVHTDVGTIDTAKLDQLHGGRPYSPYADRGFPTRPFFGDTHLHTSFSMDAGAFGARLTPRDAYRFASGEQVTATRPIEGLSGFLSAEQKGELIRKVTDGIVSAKEKGRGL